jgi:glutaredoxin
MEKILTMQRDKAERGQMTSFWSRWWRGRGSHALVDREVVLYTRTGCHLCDEAWEFLEQERRRHGFRLRAVDIDGDQELLARHGEEVPVIALDGKVRFRGGVNQALLARLFKGEAGRARG